MGTITVRRNPFLTGDQSCQFNGPLIDWLQLHYPDGLGGPIHVIVNGDPIDLDDLDVEIEEGDNVQISLRPGNKQVRKVLAVFNLQALFAYVHKYVFQLSLDRMTDEPSMGPDPDQPGDNPTYEVRGGQNPLPGFGEPIPVCYGNVLITPPYAAHPYSHFRFFSTVDPGILSYTVTIKYFAWDPGGRGRPGSYSTTPRATDTFTVGGAFSYLWTLNPNNNQWQLVTGPIKTNTFFQFDKWWNSGSKIDLRFSTSATSSGKTGPARQSDWSERVEISIVPVTNPGGRWICNHDNTPDDQYLDMLFAVTQGECQPITAQDIEVGGVRLADFDPSYYTLLDCPQSLHKGEMGNISREFNKLTGLLNAAGKVANESIAMFHEDVHTSPAVSGIELDDVGETLLFPISNSIPINTVEVDIAFPRGLFRVDDQGRFQPIVVDIEVHIYRWVSGDQTTRLFAENSSTGAYSEVAEIRAVRFQNDLFKDVSALRRSLRFPMSSYGRYAVKIKRITPVYENRGQIQHALMFTGLRGQAIMHEPNAQNTPKKAYGDTHLVALRLRANDVISGLGSNGIQIRVKRQLPDPFVAGSPIQFTSNPAVIAHDIMTNMTYGAKRSRTLYPDEFDYDLYEEMYNRWANANGFNGMFGQKVSIFDAMTMTLHPVLASPMPIGSLMSLRWEGPKQNYTQLFTEANIARGSFTMTYDYDPTGSPDGTRIAYRDNATWQQRHITIPPDALNPEDIDLVGCSDPVTAELFAGFMENERAYRRKFVRFETELEGSIVYPGDKIGVQHNMVDYSDGGEVVAYDPATRRLTLDQAVTFEPGQSYVVMLRTEEGDVIMDATANPPSPLKIAVTQIAPDIIELAVNPAMTIHDSLASSPTHYALGKVSKVVTEYIAETVTADDEVTYTIEGRVYNELVYQDVMPY